MMNVTSVVNVISHVRNPICESSKCHYVTKVRDGVQNILRQVTEHQPQSISHRNIKKFN